MYKYFVQRSTVPNLNTVNISAGWMNAQYDSTQILLNTPIGIAIDMTN
jgi:hypothetical protein